MSAYPGRSMGPGGSGQSAALLARIQEKKLEFDNLKQLRDLSAAVAGQMERLEEKLSTLSDGTEAIATVVGNWNNVLQAINMASMALVRSQAPPAGGDGDDLGSERNDAQPMPLPETLVRIPTEHAPTMQAHAEGAAAEAQTEGALETSPGGA